MLLTELPTDVLKNILLQCEPAPITETCSTFASIIHSTPTLWSSVKLASSQFIPESSVFLRSRLHRAAIRPITIVIGPVYDSADVAIISALCTAISEFNTQIIKLNILAETSFRAGSMLNEIFPDPSRVFPELQSLMILAARGREDPHTPALPYLDKQLENIDERFPGLQQLGVPTFFDCLPMPPTTASFNFLHSLVLNGIFQATSANLVCVISMLHSTPQLEALWFKNATRDDEISIHTDPEIPLEETKGRDHISIPVFLPCLTHLAVTSPGCATELLRYIVAPALQNLHLDGSRPRTFALCCDPWTPWQAKSVRLVLRAFYKNSPNLRHFAITTTFLDQDAWEWLLFGESASDPPPFPELETISLHELVIFNGESRCWFDDTLLLRFAREPRIPLRRLVLSCCALGLTWSVLFGALKAAAAHTPFFEFVINDSHQKKLSENLREELEMAGIKLTEGDDSEDNWGVNRKDHVDPFDAYVY